MIRGNVDECYFIDPLGRDLDAERAGSVPDGASVYLRGWVYFSDPERAAAGVALSIDDGPRFALAYNQDRLDVATVLGLERLRTLGFHGVWSLAGLSRGPHVLRVWAFEPETNEPFQIGDDMRFETVAASHAFTATRELDDAIDLTFDFLIDALDDGEPVPKTDLRIARGNVALAIGWGIDLVHRMPISDVFAVVDDRKFFRGIVGRVREDAASSLGFDGAWRCGYVVRIPTQDLDPGRHTVVVRGVTADGHGYETTKPIALTVAGA